MEGCRFWFVGVFVGANLADYVSARVLSLDHLFSRQLVVGGAGGPMQSTLFPPPCRGRQSFCFPDFKLASSKVLIGTGDADNVLSNDMFIMDFANPDHTCNAIEPFPVMVENADGASLNDNPTICGGKDAKDCYDFSPNRLDGLHWSKLSTDLLTDRKAMRAILLGAQELMVLGGEGDTVSDQTLILNAIGPDVTGFTLPQPLNGMCVVRVNCTHIFVAGGYTTGGDRVKQAYFYNTEEDCLIQDVEDMAFARDRIHCELATNAQGKRQIVVAGGKVVGANRNTVEIFDLDTELWSAGPELPLNLTRYSTVEYDDTIFIIGGLDYPTSPTEKILKLDQSTSPPTWTEFATLPGGPRHGHVSMQVQDRLGVCSPPQQL